MLEIKTYIIDDFPEILVDIRKAYEIFLNPVDKAKLRKLCASENNQACIQEVHMHEMT